MGRNIFWKLTRVAPAAGDEASDERWISPLGDTFDRECPVDDMDPTYHVGKFSAPDRFIWAACPRCVRVTCLARPTDVLFVDDNNDETRGLELVAELQSRVELTFSVGHEFS